MLAISFLNVVNLLSNVVGDIISLSVSSRYCFPGVVFPGYNLFLNLSKFVTSSLAELNALANNVFPSKSNSPPKYSPLIGFALTSVCDNSNVPFLFCL